MTRCARGASVAARAERAAMVVENRRRLLLRHVDVAAQKGLEIGPYLNPTVGKHEGDVRYLDYYSTDELRAREHERRHRRAVIADVDYVVKSDDYWRHVPDTFDYVIANHVIEHVDNPVQWVVDLGRLLNERGVLFLTIPDKKYNFDRFRNETTLSHLLADYFRGHGDPCEHNVDIELNYDTTYVDQPLDVDQKLDVDTLRRVAGRPADPGGHMHVFQSETFVQRILRPLQKLGIWQYQLLETGEALDNHGEFYVVLRRGVEQVEVTREGLWGPAAAGTAGEVRGDLEARLNEIMRLRAELSTAKNELAALRRSLSWRLTGPVRRILDAFQ